MNDKFGNDLKVGDVIAAPVEQFTEDGCRSLTIELFQINCNQDCYVNTIPVNRNLNVKTFWDYESDSLIRIENFKTVDEL